MSTASRWCATHDEPAAECWSAECLIPPTRSDRMTLTDFLLARLAEDEEAARELGDLYARVDYDYPARVLAEREAKRRIVEMCRWGDWSDPNYRDLGEPGASERGDVLALLALPYADHPDYREEWRA